MSFKDLVVSIDDLRNNFIKGSIYKNRPAQTCYHHAREKDILSRLEEYLAKHQLTSDTTDFYGARHVAGDLLEFIYRGFYNGYIDVGDGCCRQFHLVTTFRCW